MVVVFEDYDRRETGFAQNRTKLRKTESCSKVARRFHLNPLAEDRHD